MAYKEIQDVNTSEGMHTFLQYVAEIEPTFFPLTLFAIFIIASLGSYFAQKEFTGRGNFRVSLVAAGFMTLVITYILSIIPGLINTLTIVIVFAIFIVTLFLLFLGREK